MAFKIFKNFKIKIFLFFVFFSCNNYAFAHENQESKINYILLEQSYPTVSKEELINSFMEQAFDIKLNLNNNVACYNDSSNYHLNVPIKNAPSNLWGVWFDGGIRENKSDTFTVEDLKKTKHNGNIYLFYDHTQYYDLKCRLDIDKNFYFEKHGNNWRVPDEWRNWWWSYERWRDHWYNKKTPTESGYYLYKYGEQGFRINVNICQQEHLYFIPEHTLEELLKKDETFQNLKDFSFKTNLGDGIIINYQQPFLTFNTGNSWAWLGHAIENYAPGYSTAVSIFNVVEGGIIQGNNQQMWEGIIDVGVSFIPLPGSKEVGKVAEKSLVKGLEKTAIKEIEKDVIKGLEKTAIKEIEKDVVKGVEKRIVKGLEKTATKNTEKRFQKLTKRLKKEVRERAIKFCISKSNKEALKLVFFQKKPFDIKLNDVLTLTLLPHQKNPYPLETDDQVYFMNHLGEIGATTDDE